MQIIATGARFDPVTQTVQAVVVVTDENGGHVDHLNPHKLDAAALGHRWVDIPVATYLGFKKRSDLEAHVAANVK